MSKKERTVLFIHCDVIHPESGEVLAEPGGMLDAATPRAQRVLSVAEAYPCHYAITEFSDGTHISAEATQ